MDYIKRIVILSGVNSDEARGYLTLNKKSDSLKCQLKTFNTAMGENHILCLSIDDKPLSNIYIDSSSTNEFNFTLNQQLNIAGKINALLISEKEQNPILFGSTMGDKIENTSLHKKETFVGPEIKSFSSETFNTSPEEEKELIEKEMQKDEPFFSLVSSQIDEMFETYPKFDELETLISNSKWVKVDYDNDGLFYALGLIYENEQIKYICYAVPGESSFSPPEQIASYCQWLADEENGNGYYIMYQDALDGTSVKK